MKLAARDVAAVVRVGILAAAIGFLALVISRALPARAQAESARLNGIRADSLERVVAVQQREILALRDTAAAAAAPHANAMAATDVAGARLRAEIARVRAAARSDSITLDQALQDLQLVTDQAEAFQRLAAAERFAAAERLRPLEAIAVRIPITFTTTAQLVETRRDQVAALEARHSWWRRVLGVGCEGSSAAGGAALGAVAGGPGGAAIGAVVGVVGGAIACR